MSGLNDVRDRITGEVNHLILSEIYHENSKIIPIAPKISQSVDSTLIAPSGFKKYRYSQATDLPAVECSGHTSILSTIASRRSCREYANRALDLASISQILYYSFGVVDGRFLRCTPSAGGLYPLEVYVAALNVDSLSPGLYHYDTRMHRFDLIECDNIISKLSSSIFVEQAVKTAAAVLIITGVFGRSRIKYGERAYRFVLLEAGHAMQNICTVAAALELGTCPIGGFIDDYLNDLVDIDGVDEAALYAATLGHPT